MPTRIIAIGDIHGCAHEFDELLQKLAPTTNDRIILLGDLINRGPDSNRVIDLAKRCRAISLLGNHELRLRQYRQTRDLGLLKKEDAECLARLRGTDWDYFETMRPWHYEPAHDTVFVHGGFLPNISWDKQTADIVTKIQVVDKVGLPRKRSECEEGQFWADLWMGPPFVVYGHTPRPTIHHSKWALGIDTGCVLGGHLTACLLPGREIVQVKARSSYYSS